MATRHKRARKRVARGVGRPGGKKTPRRGGGKARRANGRGAPAWAEVVFPALASRKRRFGLGVLVAVAERQGDVASVQHAAASRFMAMPGGRPKAAVLNGVVPADVARLLSGLAHKDRVRIARSIFLGARSHHELCKAVGLKTGPLYHHLRALERAGLASVEERNCYVLTDLGRMAVLACAALAARGVRHSDR